MFDSVVVVYKYIGDLMFYVTGSQDENELVLYTVLQAFYETVTILLRCVPYSAQLNCVVTAITVPRSPPPFTPDNKWRRRPCSKTSTLYF